MSMRGRKLNRAELIRELLQTRDRIDAVLDLLVPDDEEDESCSHPASAIEDISESFDEVDQRYRCKDCGQVRTTPFTEE
jgi:hypothetical protein